MSRILIFLAILLATFNTIANDNVLRIQVEHIKNTVPGTRYGSASVLKQDKNWTYLVTSYHVLQNLNTKKTDNLRLTKADGKEVNFESLEFALYPKQDLVFIKVSRPNQINGKGVLSTHCDVYKKMPRGMARAFGYASFTKEKTLYSVPVSIGEKQNGVNIHGLTTDADVEIRYILTNPTISGMSGGLVLYRKKLLVGITLGRSADQLSFAVDALSICNTFYSIKKFQPLTALDKSAFRQKTIIQAGTGNSLNLHVQNQKFDSRISWVDNELFANMFDNIGFFKRQLHEINLPGTLNQSGDIERLELSRSVFFCCQYEFSLRFTDFST